MRLELGFLRSHVSRRLVTLFLVAALLPLGLSAWFSTHAVDGLTQRLGEQALVQGTRQVGLQVFDRLLAAKALLASWPRQQLADSTEVAMAGHGRVFRAMLPLRQDGRAVTDAEQRLLADWAVAQPVGLERQPLTESGADVRLRVLRRPEGDTRVMMGIGWGDGLRWLAELDPDYLWSPVTDMAVNSGWRVQDAGGHGLLMAGDVDQVPPLRSDLHGTSSVTDGRAWVRIFLGAEFGAADWVFAQGRPAETARLFGLPLAGWLAAVAGGSLLFVALVSLGQIRRTLGPLEQLTAGTRQLADGDTTVRVDVGSDDEFGQLAVAFNEMADRLAQQLRALTHQAEHDSLTGLCNSRGMEVFVRSMFAGAPQGAVLVIDLDHFKDVNDTLGHEAGNELLCIAADRLSGCLLSDGLVARPGGDEFVLVLPHADAAAAQAVAVAVMRQLALPFRLTQGEQVVGASVGIALAPAHGRDPASLLRCADVAMYAAKHDGRGCCRVFDSELDAQARSRFQLLAELRQAVTLGEFVAHFQPRIRPSDGAVTSAETLVRWRHPTRGVVMPGAFIPLAEESGLIEDIGVLMLDAACAQMAQWRRDGVMLPRVSVNVSPRQLASGQLLGQVREALDRNGLAADTLELEITESLLVGDARQACEQLAELRRWGVSIALDDFGTGYSSMATLRLLPVDVMKVDRAFVKDLGVDEGALAVTRAIVTLARTMKLHLVAEGIETEAQAAILRELGCDELQGFLYAKALAPEDFARLPGLAHYAPEPAMLSV